MDFVIIMCMVGIISLAGIVVNNAIVLIDFIELSKKRLKRELGITGRLDREDAIRAKEWIDSDEEEWLCSFISICRSFQIEPDCLRKRIHERVEVLRDPPLQKAA
jgi:hypothetical protein